MLDQIESLVGGSTTITSVQRDEILDHIEQHRRDKNCKGNSTDLPAPDCASIGVVNCPCIRQAYTAAIGSNWPMCIVKLGQAH